MLEKWGKQFPNQSSRNWHLNIFFRGCYESSTTLTTHLGVKALQLKNFFYLFRFKEKIKVFFREKKVLVKSWKKYRIGCFFRLFFHEDVCFLEFKNFEEWSKRLLCLMGGTPHYVVVALILNIMIFFKYKKIFRVWYLATVKKWKGIWTFSR